MSALGRKVMDLAEQQGLLDGKAIAELRKKVAESKFIVTPEAIAKVLVDHGHLTPFQARKLVSQAVGLEPEPQAPAPVQRPVKKEPAEDLTFADDAATPDAGTIDLEPDEPQSAPHQKVIPSPTQRPGQSRPKRELPVTAPMPLEGSTQDEIDLVEPAEPTRTTPRSGSSSRWKTDPVAGDEVDLAPLDPTVPTLPPLDDGLMPLEDLLSTIEPAAPMKAGPARPPPPTNRGGATPIQHAPKKNVWDSPLLLIGGGILGITLIAFVLLLYALTRGSAAEMFEQAEQQYRGGTYTAAIKLYDDFLKRYPDDPNASLARVRRGMAQLRQVTDSGSSPQHALQSAQQVLPQVEKEEKFGEARSELATILPDIADGFATAATRAETTAQKEEQVRLAGEALSLVNNPAYLPASLRKEREHRLAGILDKLQIARRSIEQDKELAATVKKIEADAEQGNAKSAYLARTELLRTYPGLESNPQLDAAVRRVGEKERQLVTVSQPASPGVTQDHAAAGHSTILSFRDGPAPTAAGKPVFVLVEGAVYGLDVANGRLLWRRFVGYETITSPVGFPAGDRTDALTIDGRRNELLRLNGNTGELVWRQSLGDAAFGPVLAGSRVFVTTRKGRILELEAATGNVVRAAQLPQGSLVAPAVDARQARILQLGEHSTLFVLAGDSLACTETVYLAHKAGSIFVSPVVLLDLVLFLESPGDDYSLIRVLAADAKTKRLAEVGHPLRRKGRITTPLSVSGRRVAAITDLGQVAVYEIDAAGSAEPLRQIAGLDPSESSPLRCYCELEGNRLWIATRRHTLLEVQAALQQLNRKWTENQNDVFVGPPQVAGDLLVQVRRKSGGAAALVEATSTAELKSLWTTHVAAPIVALAASEPRKTLDVLTKEGRLYSLTAEQLRSGNVEQTSRMSSIGGSAILADAPLSADGSTLVWTEAQAIGRVYLYDTVTGAPPKSAALPARAAAPAQAMGRWLLAPLASGGVALVAPGGGAAPVAPFMPPISPDAPPLWTRPAVRADDNSFVVSDGRGVVYSVVKKDQPQPHLEAIGQPTSAPVVSPLVLAGDAAIGIMRSESADTLVGFDGRGGLAFEAAPLIGRVQVGPFAVGGLVFVAAEPDGLVCYESGGKVRWQQPLAYGPLAGPPLATSDGDLLVIYQSGMVTRLDATTHKELAMVDVGEPLGAAARIVGTDLFLAGSDGVLHRVPGPQRP